MRSKTPVSIVLLGGIFLTITSALSVANAKSINPRPTGTAAAKVKAARTHVAEHVIRITARNFEFSPGTITVKKGVRVVLELTSADRKHGFSLHAFGVRADVKPGGMSRVVFTPDRTGRFTFSCDVFCGEGHEEMTGTLVVTD